MASDPCQYLYTGCSRYVHQSKLLALVSAFGPVVAKVEHRIDQHIREAGSLGSLAGARPPTCLGEQQPLGNSIVRRASLTMVLGGGDQHRRTGAEVRRTDGRR